MTQVCCRCKKPLLPGEARHGAYKGNESRHYFCQVPKDNGMSIEENFAALRRALKLPPKDNDND